MPDPAESAANRVALEVEGRIHYHHMLDVAREALKPIRELADRWFNEARASGWGDDEEGRATVDTLNECAFDLYRALGALDEDGVLK